MIELIDHIGIAVRSLEERIPFYRDILGLGEPELETVGDQKVRTAIFVAGEGRLELLEATDPESPIAKYIEKNGEGIHHIALRTSDLKDAIAGVLDAELRMIDEKPRAGAGGAEIAFVHPKSTGGVLLEFCRR
ncbi:MAG: methylmalonyl-CoA epimerase [Alkalispirochaeta sp.]